MSMLKPLNGATPYEAVMVLEVCGDNIAPVVPEPVVISTLIDSSNAVTVLLLESWTVTTGCVAKGVFVMPPLG